jgi:ornithine carbamoyltransferase
LRAIVDLAHAMKRNVATVRKLAPLADTTLAMLFDKPSTRTRVSFEVGIRHLGGSAIVLDAQGSHSGRGEETMADTSRVLSRYVDAIMIRTTAHERLLELAEHASVPVINGLTDDSHPCQIMADIMTFEEHKGEIRGRTLAWSGDGNNVLASLIHGAQRFGFAVRAAVPQGREPDVRVLEWARANGADVTLGHDAGEAVAGADCVITDKWVSMGQEGRAAGGNTFAPYQVNRQLLAHAARDAIFMHCLPAHRGEEVTDEVMDGPQSVVFDEAENRLHVQKAIMVWCLAPQWVQRLMDDLS